MKFRAKRRSKGAGRISYFGGKGGPFWDRGDSRPASPAPRRARSRSHSGFQRYVHKTHEMDSSLKHLAALVSQNFEKRTGVFGLSCIFSSWIAECYIACRSPRAVRLRDAVWRREEHYRGWY